MGFSYKNPQVCGLIDDASKEFEKMGIAIG
jgi:hypothetical protein